MRALAFYKGKGNWIDWCIRFATRSEYSHVEIIYGHPERNRDEPQYCYSSSARDGGVRFKNIHLSEENWDIIQLYGLDHFNSRNSHEEYEKFASELGKKYDFKGILLSQFFNLGRHNKKRWFCSEICAAFIGLPKPQTYSPESLYRTLDLMNVAFWQGQKNPKPTPLIWNPKKPKG